MEGIAALIAIGGIGWLLVRQLGRSAGTGDLDERALHDAHASLELLSSMVEPGPAHVAYVRGDAEATENLLPPASLNTRVALYMAIGQHRRAIESLGEDDAWVRGPGRELPPDALLVRINLADAYFESGQADEALRLLDDFPEGISALLDHGRWSSRAWILACLGRAEDAAVDAARIIPAALGPKYAAEGYMAKAKVGVVRGAFEPARVALESARGLIVRASSARNLIALEAELHRCQGRLTEAEALYRQAAEHRWKKQGGAFLLDWANVLEALGRPEEAVAALRQCAKQDPETPAATEARRRLQAVTAPA